MNEKIKNMKQKIENIAIIGLGSLGCYISKGISELAEIKKLILIDYDRVEKKNLENTLYKENHIGYSKVDVLTDIIKRTNPKIEIEKINEEFIENKTNISPTDLVFDCRDFVYNRQEQIDVRLSISSQSLLVDCRKKIKYNYNYEGKYLIHNPTPVNLKVAASIVKDLVKTQSIYELIKRQSVYVNSLNYLSTDLNISKSVSNFCTIHDSSDIFIHDTYPQQERLINLYENIDNILFANKTEDLLLVIGDGHGSFYEEMISKQFFKNDTDVIYLICSKMKYIPMTLNYNFFIIALNKNIIKILPETGAA